MREVILESFRQRWEHINAMTVAFAEGVPESVWNSTPHEGFAPFCKQLRHVVCVRGVYNEALRTKTVSFGRKHAFYDGGLERGALLDALHARHVELVSSLSDVPSDIERPQIDFFGRQVSYVDYLYVYIQHEAIHHGQWSLYAASAGYETPQLWRVQWGLGSGTA